MGQEAGTDTVPLMTPHPEALPAACQAQPQRRWGSAALMRSPLGGLLTPSPSRETPKGRLDPAVPAGCGAEAARAAGGPAVTG